MSDALNTVAWASRASEIPSATSLHEKASDWLEQWRTVARARGLIPRSILGVPVDLIDAMRSSILLQSADVLTALHQLDAVDVDRRREPLSGASRAVERVAHYLGRHRAIAVDRSARAGWQRVRAAGFPAKREVERFIDGLRGVRDHRHGEGVVLAIARQQGHVTDLIPIAAALRAHHGVATHFAVFDAVSEQRSAPHGTVERVQRLASPARVARGVAEALQNIAALLAVAPRRSGAVRLGDEARLLAWVARAVMLNEAPDAVRTVAATLALIDRQRPRAAVLGNPYTLEGRVAAHVLRSRRVPVIAIEHGSIFPNSPFWRGCPVDAVLAWGEQSRAVLATCGVESARVVVTGAPRTDAIVRGFVRKTTTRPRVLVATSGAGGAVGVPEHNAFIDALFVVAAAAPDVDFTIKLHPKDAPAAYENARRAYPGAHVDVVRTDPARAGEDIFDHLALSCALLTISSTAALDAMLVGVPVIAAKLGATRGSLAGVPFLNAPAVVPVTSQDELARAVRAAVAGSIDAARAAPFVERHFAHRGNAGAVAAEAIIEMSSPIGAAQVVH